MYRSIWNHQILSLCPQGRGTLRKIGWGHFQKPLPCFRAKSIFFLLQFFLPYNVLTKNLMPYLSTHPHTLAVSDLATFKNVLYMQHKTCKRCYHFRQLFIEIGQIKVRNFANYHMYSTSFLKDFPWCWFIIWYFVTCIVCSRQPPNVWFVIQNQHLLKMPVCSLICIFNYTNWS